MTYEEIDALRLKAFRTNSDADRKAYFDAASKWFQDDIYRRMDHERELATLRAEVDDLKRIIVGQCGVITELRIKLAGDAIKSFAGEALK